MGTKVGNREDNVESMNQYVNTISGRLSLRPPQRDSLAILARITEIISLNKDRDIERNVLVDPLLLKLLRESLVVKRGIRR